MLLVVTWWRGPAELPADLQLRARVAMRGKRADIPKSSISFVIVDSVADHEPRFHREAGKVGSWTPAPHQQSASPYRGGSGGSNTRHHGFQGKTGIGNILDYQDVPAPHVGLNILEDLHVARGDGAGAVGACSNEVDFERYAQFAYEICEKYKSALEHTNQNRAFPPISI